MPSPLQCIPWLVVLGTECLTIVILNAIIIIAFVKQRQPQRRSKYLIIHQTMVDLLVGLVHGPLMIEWCGSICDLWEYHRSFITWLRMLETVLGFQVYQVSFLNLAVISLERVHAELDIIRNSAPYFFRRLLCNNRFCILFYRTFCCRRVLYFYLSQSPLQSSSPALCSRCEGKKLTGTLFLVTFGSFNNVYFIVNTFFDTI